jgi:hypothetical protein
MTTGRRAQATVKDGQVGLVGSPGVNVYNIAPMLSSSPAEMSNILRGHGTVSMPVAHFKPLWEPVFE